MTKNNRVRKILVWDFPIRAFHMIFAASITAALVFSMLMGEHSPYFQWHMLCGIVALFAVGIRFVLGIIGSKPIRWSTAVRTMTELLNFFKTDSSKETRTYATHNPSAWWVYMGMFVLLTTTALSGIYMSRYESLEDIHEVAANGLLVLVILHLVGLLAHRIFKRENLAFSMVDGKKLGTEDAAISNARPFLGIVVLACMLGFIVMVIQGYSAKDSQLTLPLFGWNIDLRENEGESHNESDKGKEKEREGHDDDDDKKEKDDD